MRSLSPTERGVVDAARLKKIREKVHTPGPGAYSPARLSQSKVEYGGSYAFRSQTERAKRPHSTWDEDTGEPGNRQRRKRQRMSDESKAESA